MIRTLAVIDPMNGDSVTKNEITRTVVSREGDKITYYQNEKGVLRTCNLKTWVKWSQGATKTITVGQSKFS